MFESSRYVLFSSIHQVQPIDSGDSFLSLLVLTRRGAALVQTATSNHFPRRYKRGARIITSTDAELGDISHFQYCTGNVSGSEDCKLDMMNNSICALLSQGDLGYPKVSIGPVPIMAKLSGKKLFRSQIQ